MEIWKLLDLIKLLDIDIGCHHVFNNSAQLTLGPKKKLMLPSPDQNLKIGKVGRFFFFFTYRERVEFSNIFF